MLLCCFVVLRDFESVYSVPQTQLRAGDTYEKNIVVSVVPRMLKSEARPGASEVCC